MMTRNLYTMPNLGFYSILNDFDRLSKNLDLFGNQWFGQTKTHRSGIFPAVNVTEDEDNYFIRAELPEVKSEDLDIQVTGNTVSISGERKIAAENEGAKYHRREREAGKFSRMISLSREIDTDKIDASLKNGILKVVLRKSEAAKPKKITVN